MVLISFTRIIARKLNPSTFHSKMPSSDMTKFREIFRKSNKVVVLTGAGVSAESGVPTFRGAGGLWRKYKAQELASPDAFYRDPSLVWEFYHYRREVMATKEPNNAHRAIAEAQARFKSEGRSMVVVTQNIDELHNAAGTEDIIELHGSLFRTQCLECGVVKTNRDSPICEALQGKGDRESGQPPANIPKEKLPRCTDCGGLLRPAVIWFGEMLDDGVLDKASKAIQASDLVLVVGTSSVVYPAALFAPDAAARGIPVAEFNVEPTGATERFGFYFEGPCGETLPVALSP